MTTDGPAAKAILREYLQAQRQVLLDKLDGLSEQQARTPVTGTGTNVAGVIKHAVSVESAYLGMCVGRPFPVELPWLSDDAPDNDDMWLTPSQSIGWLVDLCRQIWAHADASIEALDLDAPGSVPWWPGREVTLQRLLVHVIAEYARHAGHLDIAREQLDGAVGYRAASPNLPSADDAQWWADYVAKLRAIAAEASTEPVHLADLQAPS